MGRLRRWVDRNFDFTDPLMIPAMGVYFLSFAILHYGVGIHHLLAGGISFLTQFALGLEHLQAKWKRDDDA